MGTVLVLHKRNKMQHKNRPHIATMLHSTPVPSVTNPFLFVSDCPGFSRIALDKMGYILYNQANSMK